MNYCLPIPARDWESLMHHNPLIVSELDCNKDEEERQSHDQVLQLNPDQEQIYNTILNQIIRDPTKAQFFIYGLAGTGKTFLYKCICHYYRS